MRCSLLVEVSTTRSAVAFVFVICVLNQAHGMSCFYVSYDSATKYTKSASTMENKGPFKIKRTLTFVKESGLVSYIHTVLPMFRSENSL